jgi:asparagine synthase (glutamine-hydrolysing)
MCGFSLLAFVSLPDTLNAQLFEHNFDRIEHRGREGRHVRYHENFWAGHHRLAFQDKAGGNQPMQSAAGNWWILFNGEIYNHFELRSKLKQQFGTQFRTRSDTETLVEMIEARDGFHREWWELLEGEFSFVAIRNDGSQIIASRDYFGVKPLFLQGNFSSDGFQNAKSRYEFNSRTLCFSSEQKGLTSPLSYNKTGLQRQFMGLYEPIRTPFEGVIALPGGSIFTAKKQGEVFHCTLELQEAPIRKQAKGSTDALEFNRNFRNAFSESVKDRLLSDVELGVYLSGGIDSRAVGFELNQILKNGSHSSIAAQPKSFTVGFEDGQYDESESVRSFARAFGFESHLLKLNHEALAYSYPIAVAASENIQPYTNGAAKWWLSHFARQHLRGVLTGDGADELLGGYPSFRYAAWWKFQARGGSWRKSVYQKRFIRDTNNPWAAGSSSPGDGQDFEKSLALWGVPHPLFGQIEAIANCYFSDEKMALDWIVQQRESVASWFLFGFKDGLDPLDPQNALLLWQNYFCKTHLPVQVLNWVGDRMEMAGNLEGRTPFLSKKLRELIFEMPDQCLVAGFQDKAILRRSFAHDLGDFARAPKKQFGAPFLNSGALAAQFPFQEAMGLVGGDANTFLTKVTKLQSNSSGHLQTHYASALQTALSMGIVHSALVKGVPLERDLAWEKLTLQTAHTAEISNNLKNSLPKTP